MLGRLIGRKDAADKPTAKDSAKPVRPPVAVPGRAAAPPKPLPARPRAEEDDAEATPLRGVGKPAARSLPAVAPGSTKVGARVAARAPVKDDKVDELAEIETFSGRVLTAEGASIALQAAQRRYVAALDNDVLLIAASHKFTGPVSSAQVLLQRSSFRPTRILLVEMEVIRKVYDADQKRNGGVESLRDTAQMQRAVIELVRGAARERCSDIHIIVRRFEAEVRVRSDGVMMKLQDMHAANAQDLCQAAFNMADASDASYKPYEYQGARITSLKTALPDGVQAVRLQFNPLPDGGRYLIMRLLYSQKVRAEDDIDQLGYTQAQIRQIKRMRRKSYGINIISGPTGSGKSTTLQRSLGAGLRELNYTKNVITVEDPPEYEIFGAAQLPVTNAKTDAERKEAFRQAITASLRSDPDIVMIGEIRDGASAGLAFQASMTGHQVWASLHANDALSILDRLRDMGVELYRLSDYTLVTGLVGQRLIKTLCPKCKLGFDEGLARGYVAADTARIVCEMVGEERARASIRCANPEGCQDCRNGYAGRTVTAEVILPDRNFMGHIARDEKIEAREYWLEKLGGTTMVENAMVKCMDGRVDLRDVEEVGLIDEVDPKRMKSLLFGELKAIAS